MKTKDQRGDRLRDDENSDDENYDTCSNESFESFNIQTNKKQFDEEQGYGSYHDQNDNYNKYKINSYYDEYSLLIPEGGEVDQSNQIIEQRNEPLDVIEQIGQIKEKKNFKVINEDEFWELGRRNREEDPEHTAFLRSLYHYRWRWYALILICLLKVGGNFCYDTPADLQEAMEKTFNLSITSYSLMYVLYSLPNIIIPLGNAYILKYMSLKKSLIVMSSLIVVSQLVMAFGAWLEIYSVILIGRMMFGLGFGYLQMTQILYVFKWFLDAEISLAMGISQLSIIFDYLGGKAAPVLMQQYSIAVSFLFGSLFCLFSLVIAYCIYLLDDYTDSKDQELIFDYYNNKDIRFERFEWQKIDDKYELDDLEQDIDDFEDIYWLFVVDNMLTIAIIFTTIAIGPNFMTKNFGFSGIEASRFVTLPYLVSAFSFVPLGIIADRYGQRQYLVICGGLCMMLCYIIFLIWDGSNKSQLAEGPWYLLGFPLAVFYILQWGSLPFLVKSSSIKIALGIFISTFNLANALMPLLVSSIHDFLSSKNYDKYHAFFYVFLILSFFSVIIKVTILYWDQEVRRGILLDKDPLQAHLDDQERALI